MNDISHRIRNERRGRSGGQLSLLWTVSETVVVAVFEPAFYPDVNTMIDKISRSPMTAV